MKEGKKIISIISDTHGLLRKSVIRALKDSALIVHAGDIDTPDILDKIQQIAPVVVARGNMDKGDWAESLPGYDVTEIAGKMFYVIHDLYQINMEPIAAGIAAVISGHTHQPSIMEQKGVLYINPGSAGPRRSGKPVTIGKLIIQNGTLFTEIINLKS